MRLQWQFNLVVVPLVVVPLLVLGVTAFGYLLESEQHKLMNNMTTSVAHMRQKVDMNFSKIKANLELLATDGVMMRYAVIEDEYTRYKIYQGGLLERFKSYQENFPLYEEIRFILQDGYEDTHWGAFQYRNTSEDESDQSWYQHLPKIAGSTLNIIEDNPDTGLKSLYSFKPILLRNTSIEDSSQPKTLRGFLGTTITLEWLKQELKSLLNAPNQYVAFMNENGDILFYFGDEHLTTFITPNTGMHLLDTDEGGIYQAREKTLFGYSLVYLVNENQAYDKASRLALSIIVITLVSIAFTLLVLLFLLRHSMIRPLQALMSASKDIASGELSTLVPDLGCDELSDLSHSFNDMAKSLSDSDEKIRYIAYHDSLTRLPNRRMFQYLLNNAIAASDRNKDKLALIFLDVDNFKTVNDSLGHDVGDILLQQFAGRIGECLRDEDAVLAPDSVTKSGENPLNQDLVARLGGDEFTVLLPHLQHATDASYVGQRIIEAMEKPFFVNDHHFKITTSIGITICPDNGQKADELIKFADIALYHAKSLGKNNFQFYSSDLNEAIADRIDRENELREAIEGHQLSVYFQPQIDAKSGGIYGMEALVRWHHPTKGLISPLNFIILAEETGMIIELGTWVMYESCRIAKSWLLKGLLDFRISVNVSSRQFERQDVAQLVEDALRENGLSPKYLTVELTESVIMSSRDKNIATLSNIKEKGVKISLDDFGTGYSSLSYLRTFPVDTLKIDQQFIKDSETDPEVRSIISAIVMMAHALGLDVVAEGVEGKDEFLYLQSINCDIIQGFYFSKALPHLEAEIYIKESVLKNIAG
mgnify:CR=1 FL=1